MWSELEVSACRPLMGMADYDWQLDLTSQQTDVLASLIEQIKLTEILK